MAEALVQISGVLYDKLSRTERPVLLQGAASLMGVGVGGGPVIPPSGGDGPVDPGWGIPGPPYPTHPIYRPGPPVDPGWGIPEGGHVMPPIYYPPNVPPSLEPPQPPNAGDPTTPVPPPAGSSGWPVQPIQPPPYIVVNYPGIGPVTVAPPLTAQPK